MTHTMIDTRISSPEMRQFALISDLRNLIDYAEVPQNWCPIEPCRDDIELGVYRFRYVFRPVPPITREQLEVRAWVAEHVKKSSRGRHRVALFDLVDALLTWLQGPGE